MNSNPNSYKFIKAPFTIGVLCLCFISSFEVHATQYDIEIVKSKQELVVKYGDHIVKRFRASYGSAKGTKQISGDSKTPIGIYKITDFKHDSKFHFFMHLDYPNMLDAWSGYKNRVISASDFKKIAIAYRNKQRPPQDTILGGYIGIHGLGFESEEKLSIHKETNWTEGCIALTNQQIIFIKNDVGYFICGIDLTGYDPDTSRALQCNHNIDKCYEQGNFTFI